MNPRIIFWSIVSALAGFLFGFDTVVISGAEKTIQALWGLSPGMHGIAMGSALYGTVVGAMLGNWPTDRFGRKATLLWIGVLYFISAVWSGLAPDVYSFIAARVIGGIGIGVSTIAAPLYIAEIAPAQWRGRLAGLFSSISFSASSSRSPRTRRWRESVRTPGGGCSGWLHFLRFFIPFSPSESRRVHVGLSGTKATGRLDRGSST
jgi:MFS family permease